VSSSFLSARSLLFFFPSQPLCTSIMTLSLHDALPISNMAIAYAAADVIISRAGALAIAELCLVGKPSVFIPSPNVAEDHQTKNAQAIVNHDAAMLVKEQEIDSTFVSRFTRLMQSDEKQKLFSNNIKKLAKPNATEEIVDVVEKLISA